MRKFHGCIVGLAAMSALVSCESDSAVDSEPVESATGFDAVVDPEGKSDSVGHRDVVFSYLGTTEMTGQTYRGVSVARAATSDALYVDAERVHLLPQFGEVAEVSVRPLGFAASHTDDLQFALYFRAVGATAWRGVHLGAAGLDQPISTFETIAYDTAAGTLDVETRLGDGTALSGRADLSSLLPADVELAVAVYPYATWFGLEGAYDYELTASCSGRACRRPADSMGFEDRYELQGDSLFPEAAVFDASSGAMLVGSLSDGSIRRLTPDGVETPFSAGQPGHGALGMAIDEAQGTLWVCTVEHNEVLDGSIWVYDLATEERLATIALNQAAPDANCNDLVMVGPGEALVTDREQPHIYRVQFDSESASGSVEIFAEDDLLDSIGVGTNGIAVTPDGKGVVVTNYLPARLMWIGFDDPKNVVEIDTRGDHFFDGLGGADGATFVGGALYVAMPGRVARVVPEGSDWSRARVQTAKFDAGGASDVVVIGTELYLIGGQVASFVIGNTPDLPFSIHHFDWAHFE